MSRTARLAFPILISLLPVFAVLSPHGLVPLALLAAVALLPDPAVRTRFQALARGPLATALLCLLLWAAVSTLWAPRTGGSLLLVAQVAAVMAIGGLLLAGAECADEHTRRRAAAARCFAAPVLLLLAFSGFLDGGVLVRAVHGWPPDFVSNPIAYDRAAAIGAIVAWPIAFVLWRTRRPAAAILFLVLTFFVLFQLQMAAARLAFVIGGVAFAISYWRTKFSRRALAVLMLAGILAAPPILAVTGTGNELPVISQDAPSLSSSIKHRFLIWQFVLNKIAAHPVLGYGFDSSRHLPGGSAPAMNGQSVLPLHPHNGILQVWLELGLPGALIAAAIVMLILRAMSAFEPRGPAAMANATFAAFVTIALASYGIWQNWWLVTAWLAAVLAMFAAGARPAAR